MHNSILQSLVYRAGSALFNAAILVLSARYLGVITRGEISLFLFNIALIQLFAEVFTGYHLVHFMQKFNTKKIYLYGLAFILVINTFGHGALLIFGKLIEGYHWQAFFITLFVCFNTFHCVLILGLGKIRLYYTLSILQPALLLLFISVYILFNQGLTLNAYTFPLLLSFFLASVFSLIKIWPFLKQWSAKPAFNIGPIFRNGLAAQMALVMFLLGSKYSFYLLKPEQGLGVYALSLSMAESVLIAVQAMMPLYLSKIATGLDTKRIRSITAKLISVSLLICSLLLLGLHSLPENLYLRLLGNGFAGIKHILLCYSPAVLISAIYIILSNFFTGRGEARLVFLCNLPGLAITLILYPLLIERYHLYGAALSSVIVLAVSTLFLLLCFFRLKQNT